MRSHRTQLPLLILAFAALLLLAACGGQTAATVAPGSTEAPPATAAPAATAATATQAPATTAPEPTAAPTTAPKPAATTPPTTAPEPTLPPAPTAAAAGGGTLDEVMSAARAQMTQKGYRTRILSESAGTKTEMSVEFVAPDRYHIVSPATEMIIIADKTYMKQGNTWTQMPMDMGAMLKQFQDPAFMMESTGLVMSNVSYKGVEEVDGVPADLYEYDSTITLQETPYSSHTQLWVSKETGLPLKSANTSELAGVKSVATTLYEYPTDLTIEAPIK